MHKDVINIENQWSKYQYQEDRKVKGRKIILNKNKDTYVTHTYTYKEEQQWQKLVTGKD